jgi:hypothetical protein
MVVVFLVLDHLFYTSLQIPIHAIRPSIGTAHYGLFYKYTIQPVLFIPHMFPFVFPYRQMKLVFG